MRADRSSIRFLIFCFLGLFLFANASAVQSQATPAKKIDKAKSAAKRKAAQKTLKKKRAKPAAQKRRAASSNTRRRYARKQAQTAKRVAVRRTVRKVAARRLATPVAAYRSLENLPLSGDRLRLHSNAAFVLDLANSKTLLDKNSDVAMPIASLTKLMTALVVVEAGQDMDEILSVSSADVDRIKYTSSRLPVGARLSRSDMLHIALMSSENRAASALGRHFPGGLSAFVKAMNAKAQQLGMTDTRFVEPTGLSSANVATARDLAKLVVAAHEHPVIAGYSTSGRHAVNTGRGRLQYVSSNRLIGKDDWEIELQKTGYIREAGRCLVMKVIVDSRPVVMVLLDSDGHLSRFADASRLRNWMHRAFGESTTADATLAQEHS